MLSSLKRILLTLALASVLYSSLHAFGENPTQKHLKELDSKLEDQSAKIDYLVEMNQVITKENNALKTNIQTIKETLKMHENNINSVYDETQRLNRKTYKLIELNNK